MTGRCSSTFLAKVSVFALTSDIPKILICRFTTYERNGWPSHELSQWLEDLRMERRYLTSITRAHNFSPAAGARNYLLNEVKKMPKHERPDWILMIDNDMVPCENLLSTIDHAPEDAGVVVPRFYMWDPQKQSVILCWGMDTKDAPEIDGTQIFRVEPDKYYELTKCGTGAMFIRPDMLDEMILPFFQYSYNQLGCMTGTEDIWFCQNRVAKTSYKIYGCSNVEVGHYHNVDLALLAKWLYSQEVKRKEQGVENLSPLAECFR